MQHAINRIDFKIKKIFLDNKWVKLQIVSGGRRRWERRESETRQERARRCPRWARVPLHQNLARTAGR